MRLSIVVLLIGAALATTARGQSLSIVKKGDTNFWIEASAPQNNPCSLQATVNLHLWADIHDPIQGQYSSQLNPTGGLERFFRLTASASAPPIKVMLIGDSMTADCCGWGAGIYGYFKPNAPVINYAVAWASTSSFLAPSDEMSKMLVVKPDYVLIQFGYMDQGNSPERYTTLQQFGDNLRTIVNTVRSFNGIPILVTLHAARIWDARGNVIPCWQDRNAVTQDVAAELKTPLIDLNQLTMDLFQKLGPSCNSFFHWPGGAPEDVMHLSTAGAVVVSQLVVNALPDSFGPYLTGIFDPPPLP